MNTTCKRCGSEIVKLSFSEEQKLEIWGLIVQDFKLFAVRKIKDEYRLSLRDAKATVAHINKDFGKCHRCNFDELIEENMDCPKCKAFNYNLKMELSFNQEFCTHLEYRLNFGELEDERVQGFWCDGIDYLPIEMRSLAKSVLRVNQEIKTKAWIGKSGQEIYEMTIRFGKESVENYLQNQSLIDCISKNSCKEWLKIEPEKKKVEIKLI